MEEVLLLTKSFEFHRLITWKDAIKLICRNRVETIRYSGVILSNGFKLPKVLRLINEFKRYHCKGIRWNKDNMLLRDNFSCVYCGVKLTKDTSTIDHVYPRCFGGKTIWTNVVTSCDSCNNIKGNRTPEQANMKLNRKPYEPSVSEIFQRKAKISGVKELLKEFGIF